MLYELWDTESGTLLGAYSTEAEALAVVRANVQRYGAEYVAAWSLGRLDDSVPLLEGAPLLERARTTIPTH
jgi:hypothetical protein